MEYSPEQTTGFAGIPPSEFLRRVETIPLPTSIKTKLVSTFVSWMANSGKEWAVGRLKDFKDCILQSQSNGYPSHKPEWFATTRSGKLRGVFGTLQRIALSSPEKLEAVLNLLGMASAITRESIPPSVAEDIRKNVTSTPVKTRVSLRGPLGKLRMRIATRKLGLCRTVKCGRPTPLLQVLPGKLSHAQAIPYDISDIREGWIWDNHREWLERTIGAEVDETVQYSSRPPLPPIYWEFQPLVGNVHVTHEPGLKTRYFASPNVVLQRAVEPLKDALLTSLKKVPWDCTLDQRKADCTIQTALDSGKIVHSVDMSSATDHFPWFFQKEVLRTITNNKGTTACAVRLFIDIVERGGWLLPDGKPGRWTKGQPLGLGPSFPIFTLSHGLLLYMLNGMNWDQKWYVLGDDVVILDDTLHELYRKTLAEWEVPVSKLKSFSSNRIAQFAGVTYVPLKHFWVPKWRPMTRDTILDLQAWWYPGLTRGMKDASLIDWVLSLPEPYGLGRNPKGIPLSVRFPDHLVEELISLEQARALRSKPTKTRVSLHNLMEICTLHEGVKSLISRSLNVRQDWKKGRISTEIPIRISESHLIDGTEIPGYPRLRLSPRSVDPYSIGNLTRWKRIKKSLPPDT